MSRKLDKAAIVCSIITVIISAAFLTVSLTAEPSFAAAKKPARVKGVTLSRGGESEDGSYTTIKVKWSKVKNNVTKYQVSIKSKAIKASADGSKSETAEAKATTKKVAKSKKTTTFKGMPGVTYTVKVRALNGKAKGKWSAAKKITIKEKEPEPLSQYWTPGSEVAAHLVKYVETVTDENNKVAYIPEKDRIAVFDMDGTLTCETYYTYYDTMMFIEYCLNDHPEKVSDELKEEAAAIRPGYTAGEALARNFAKAYAGMTMQEFYDYAVEFGKKKTASFENMRYIDGFYLPMVELVKYLYDNKFTIYVISGTERTTTRAIVANSPIKDYVTPDHVIGTDFEVKQKGYEDVSSNMDYKYKDGDELVLTGGFVQKNLNANKSIYIEREIGRRPVLAFGNSGSDTSMMNYALDSRNPYLAEAYMIVADDDVREWGKQDWEKKSADYKEQGYVPVSMKNDFAEIYPAPIKRAEVQYVEPELEKKAA